MLNQQDPQDIPAENELLSIESYQLIHSQILKSGRLTHFIPKSISEEEIEEFLQKAQEEDPASVPMENFSAESSKNWEIRMEGDKTLISSSNGENSNDRQVVHLKHKNWKGSHNVYDQNSRRFTFFYCGYGLNNSQEIYPLKFYKIQKCPEDLTEFSEPNGELEEEKKRGRK